jgi:hypothetical protein
MRHRGGHEGIIFQQVGGSVHAWTTELHVVEDRKQELDDEYSWEEGHVMHMCYTKRRAHK